jgi:ribokinase
MAAVLEAQGVDIANLQRGAGASGMSVAITEQDGGYAAVIVPAENHALDLDALAIPSDARLMLLQNELAPAALPALSAKARAAGLGVILNAAPAHGVEGEVLAAVETLIVNRLEALDLLGASPSVAAPAPDEIVDGLRTLAPQADIVLTLAAEGAAFAASGQPVRHQPAPAVEARSTHGAGDVFCGTFAAARLARRPLAEAVETAQAAAAAHVALERV